MAISDNHKDRMSAREERRAQLRTYTKPGGDPRYTRSALEERLEQVMAGGWDQPTAESAAAK